MDRSRDCRRELRAAAESLDNRNLGALVGNGIAFHHAGLELQDRSRVEDLFTRGFVKVRAATVYIKCIDCRAWPPLSCRFFLGPRMPRCFSVEIPHAAHSAHASLIANSCGSKTAFVRVLHHNSTLGMQFSSLEPPT